jgi:hypothetical protein
LIRSIWFGLIFLIVLLAFASLKLAFGPPRPVAAAEMPLPTEEGELVDAALGALSDATTKGDRLQISYVPAVVPGAVVPEPQHKLPFSPPLKIISRHWHERPVQVAVRKRPGLKNEALVLERRLLLDTNACTSSGLDRLKQMIDRTARCKSGS